MPKKQYRYVTQAELDARPDHMLRDGEALKVRLSMMDAMQRDIARFANERFRVTAADGSTGLSLHRPGYRLSDIALEAEKSVIYDEYDRRITSAWQDARGDHPETGFGENGSLDLQVGDECSVKEGGGRFGPEGARGTIQRVDGRLVSVADDRSSNDARPVRDARSHQQIIDELYRRRDEELTNAWRQPS
jgi:hypothetical protein